MRPGLRRRGRRRITRRPRRQSGESPSRLPGRVRGHESRGRARTRCESAHRLCDLTRGCRGVTSTTWSHSMRHSSAQTVGRCFPVSECLSPARRWSPPSGAPTSSGLFTRSRAGRLSHAPQSSPRPRHSASRRSGLACLTALRPKARAFGTGSDDRTRACTACTDHSAQSRL